MLWFYAEGAVLVADALELGDELRDVVDTAGEAEDDDGQCPGQAAVLEVDDIEGVVELGVSLDEGAVDYVRDGLAVLLEEWYGPLDQLCLLICQRHGSSRFASVVPASGWPWTGPWTGTGPGQMSGMVEESGKEKRTNADMKI